MYRSPTLSARTPYRILKGAKHTCLGTLRAGGENLHLQVPTGFAHDEKAREALRKLSICDNGPRVRETAGCLLAGCLTVGRGIDVGEHIQVEIPVFEL